MSARKKEENPIESAALIAPRVWETEFECLRIMLCALNTATTVLHTLEAINYD